MDERREMIVKIMILNVRRKVGMFNDINGKFLRLYINGLEVMNNVFF